MAIPATAPRACCAASSRPSDGAIGAEAVPIGQTRRAMSDAPTPPQVTAGLAMALAAVAGFLDAHIFLYVSQVFVANMSGNLIDVGMAVGQRAWVDAARALAAIGAFVIGVACASRWLQVERAGGRLERLHRALGAEAVLVAASAALVVLGPDPIQQARPVELAIVVLAAVAMGIQAAAIGHVGKVSVTTTYESGALVRVGGRIAALVGGADPAAAPTGRDRTLVVLSMVIVGYVAGGAVAAFAGEATAWLAVPIVALAVGAVALRPRTVAA